MRFRTWLNLGLLTVLLAGLGGAEGAAQTADTTLKVGILPITDVAPLYLGMEKGFFKDEHLTVEPVPAHGGGAVVAAVVSGDQQFGYGNVVSMMLAIAHGLPLEAVADGSQSIADGHHGTTYMIAAANGPIKTARDFEGKTVAVNALKTMSELMIKEVLTRDGVDVSKVKFVEIPNEDMAAALSSGRVDIVMEPEPFLTADKSDGGRELFEPYDEYAPKVTLATYFTSRQYAVDHPDVVARFRRAMLKSLAYATANPAEVRRIVPSFTKIDAATASAMALVGFGTAIDMPSVEKLQQSMLKLGWISKPIDLKAAFPANAVAGK